MNGCTYELMFCCTLTYHCTPCMQVQYIQVYTSYTSLFPQDKMQDIFSSHCDTIHKSIEVA